MPPHTYEEFRPRTCWSLWNAMTTVLGPMYAGNPQRYAALTMSLQGLIGEAAGLAVDRSAEVPIGLAV
jgi:hypothetical protein